MSKPSHSQNSNSLNSSGALGEGAGRGDLVKSKGGSISAGLADAEDKPAFVHVAPRHMPVPVVIAVPHAGRAYPAAVIEQMRDSGQSQLRLEDRLIDTVGVEVAQATGTGLLVAHAPRAMVDLNRAADDLDWAMIARPKDFDKEAFLESLVEDRVPRASSNARARSGLGLVPRRLPGSGEIWRSKLSPQEVSRRVEHIHRPYHTFLAKELERVRDAWGAALLIDLHSMPPLRRRDGEGEAPRIVIGDRYGVSCDSAIANHAFRYLEYNGVPTAHNRPYSGGYVLDRHARPSKGIHAIQIEVCRSAYLDSALSQTTDQARSLAQMLVGLVRVLGAETAGLGSGGQIAQAAE